MVVEDWVVVHLVVVDLVAVDLEAVGFSIQCRKYNNNKKTHIFQRKLHIVSDHIVSSLMLRLTKNESATVSKLLGQISKCPKLLNFLMVHQVYAYEPWWRR